MQPTMYIHILLRVHDFGFFRYYPDAIQFLNYEAACIGLEIRVVGNYSGEKVLPYIFTIHSSDFVFKIHLSGFWFIALLD